MFLFYRLNQYILKCKNYPICLYHFTTLLYVHEVQVVVVGCRRKEWQSMHEIGLEDGIQYIL